MASSDQEEVLPGENGNARRTRSGRAVKSPVASTRSTRGKKPSKKPVFDDCDELNEMTTEMSDYFEPDETSEFELPLGCDKSTDSPNTNIAQSFGEESNGSMDGMLKTCFRENLNNDPEMMEQSIPFEPMDVSIVDSTSFSESVPLEFDKNDDGEYFDIQNELTSSKVAHGAVVVRDGSREEIERIEEVADDSDDAEPIVIKKSKRTRRIALEEVEDADSEVSLDKKVTSLVKTSQPIKLALKVPDNAEKKPSDESSEALKTDSFSDTEEMEERGESGETEVVSEDELPGVEKPEVKDAENVSDDELPGPKPADLPADTEVVSEDELPSAKKESRNAAGRKRKTGNTVDSGYDPGSPTSEDEGASKKQAISKDGEAKPTAAEKRLSEDKTSKKKVLPELDKYWKAVNDDAADFTGWTYLLQYVDQENEVEAAREAYDAFLSHYPYCYGYWRKYADYEKRKGIKKKCLEVLERGLRGIPLSVDLWIHFLNHIKATRADDIEHIRQQYERAVGACGLEFRSDRLWESYIKWESENGVLLNVTALYDRLLSTPTLGYITHFDNFQEHIMMNAAHAVIPIEIFVQLRAEVRAESKTEPVPDSDPDIPPGEEEADDHTRSDDEVNAIKEKIITIRRKVHKVTIDQVAQRWNFEEGIKRPYFHVKPLERCQLKNWKSYLEWEEEKGDSCRTLVLYERCLIACALYEEFWLRLVQYLETRAATLPDDAEEEKSKLITKARDVLERACTIHHLDKPSLHLRWAFFEENQGNPTRASEILERLDKTCPNLLQVAYRRINLERRRKDFEKCCQLYESYISSSKSKATASNLSIKYARFQLRFKNDIPAATRILRAALVRDPTCHRLYLQMVDIAMFSHDFDLNIVIGYLDEYLAIEGVDHEFRMQFSQRKLELLEEMGTSVDEIQLALQAYQTLAKQQHKKKNKDKVSGSESGNSGKKKGDNAAPPLPPTGTGQSATGVNSSSSGGVGYGSSGYGTGTGGTYNYSAPPPSQPAPQPHYDSSAYPPQPYQQTPWTQYQQPPNPYQHNPWTPYQNYY